MAEHGPELDMALPGLLRADAAGVVAPPVQRVRARARRRRRAAAAWSTAAVAAVLVLAAGTVPVPGGGTPLDRLAGAGSTTVLAEGVDDAGPWRLEWRPVGRCLTRVRADGEGGACDLADPPDLRELSVSLSGPADAPDTLVAGLVPTGTASVAVTASGGEPVEAEIVRAGDATLFVTTLPGVAAVQRVVARDADGEVVGSFDGPTMPPPGPPVGPVGVAPGARGEVEATWAVAAVSDDRRTLTVVAVARAGACTRPGATQAFDTGAGLRVVVHVDVPLTPDPCPPADPLRIDVELPRPLRQDEAVLGACDPAQPECAALGPASGG